MKLYFSWLVSALFFIPACIAQELPSKGICAHRGASETHPENTLASIKEAIRLGAQMIEFDIRKTKDNALVVIHNKTVDETTDGKGKVEELTLEQARQFDAGSWKDPKFKGEKIPLFEEVLDIVPRNILMNIHIKGGGVFTAEEVACVLTKKGLIANAVVACSGAEITAVRKANPAIRICCMDRGNSVEEYVDETIRVKTEFIQLRKEALPDIINIVKKLKSYNIKINYFYAETEEELKILLEAGVDFPLVNNPGTMLEYYAAWKARH